jgi:DNA polymerase-3 subunit epsilon
VPVEQLASLTLASHAGVHEDAPAAAAVAAAPAPAPTPAPAADVSPPPPRICSTDGEVIAMDVETTGLRVDSEIIQIALAFYTDGELRRTFTRRFCPSGEISDGARAVHGISKEMLVNEDRFADWAEETRTLLQRADGLLCYLGFDLKMVERELARAGVEKLDLTGKTLYDPYKLWIKLETRKLPDAVRRFINGAELLGAHDAGADIAATLHVHNGLVAEFETQLSSAASITALSRGDCIDLDGKFSWPAPRERIGSIIFALGKHQGSPLFPCRTAREWKNGWDRASACTSAASDLCDKVDIVDSYLDWMMGADFAGETLWYVLNARWVLAAMRKVLALFLTTGTPDRELRLEGQHLSAWNAFWRLRPPHARLSMCGCGCPSTNAQPTQSIRARRSRCALPVDLSDCHADIAKSEVPPPTLSLSCH